MDWTFWVLEGSILGVLGLFGAILLGIRQLSRLFSDIPGLIQRLAGQFLWEEEEVTGEDGSKKLVKRPSKQLAAAVEALAPVVMPLLLAQGKRMLSKVSLSHPGDSSGAGGLSSLLGAGGMLPKRIMGIDSSLLLTLAERFLPGLLSKGSGGTGGGGGGGTGISPTLPK